MGGRGSGRITKEQKIVNSLSGRRKLKPIATNKNTGFGDLIIPNHSGDHSAGSVLKTPVNDLDIVNKKYVDDSISNLDHLTDLLNVGTNTHSQIDTHIADGTIHFTEGSIDHTAITNIGTNSHTQIDTHIADNTLHFTEASIDHLNIGNIGTNTHADIDTHINDISTHFLENTINHNNILNIGTNSHTDIDAHIANTSDPHNITWAQVDKTVSNINDIVLKSHTSLSDIGTNTHSQIDTHIANTSNPHSVTAEQARTASNTLAGTFGLTADGGFVAGPGVDIIMKMGDSAGTNLVSYRDIAGIEVGYINSDGDLSLKGDINSFGGNITVNVGNDIKVTLGDDAGANKISWVNSIDEEQLSLTSNGTLTATTISAQSVSATTIGGIASGNLLDKGAVETVSGKWRFTSPDVEIFGGRLKFSGTGTAVSNSISRNASGEYHIFPSGHKIQLFNDNYGSTQETELILNSGGTGGALNMTLKVGGASDEINFTTDNADIYKFDRAIESTGTITNDSGVKVPGVCIWAEEGGALSVITGGGHQFSFGNGVTATHGIPQPASGKIYATSISWKTGSTNGTGRVQISKNGTAVGTTLQMSAGTGTNGSNTYTDATGISFNAGDNLNFKTTTDDTGTDCTGIIVCMWIVYD